MRQTLDNFFKRPTTQTTVTIQRQTAPGRYLVEDSQGRRTVVDSATTWQPGTPVVVINSRIIARAGRLPAATVVEV